MLSCDKLALVEELVQQAVANSGKPTYDFGKGGANPAWTWLEHHGRPTNKVGIPFGLNNGKLTEIWVGNEDLVAYSFGVYYHFGNEIGLTLLKQVSIPAANRTKTFAVGDIGDISVPKDCQIATRVMTVTTSPKNIGAHLTIRGTN